MIIPVWRTWGLSSILEIIVYHPLKFIIGFRSVPSLLKTPTVEFHSVWYLYCQACFLYEASAQHFFVYHCLCMKGFYFLFIPHMLFVTIQFILFLTNLSLNLSCVSTILTTYTWLHIFLFSLIGNFTSLGSGELGHCSQVDNCVSYFSFFFFWN